MAICNVTRVITNHFAETMIFLCASSFVWDCHNLSTICSVVYIRLNLLYFIIHIHIQSKKNQLYLLFLLFISSCLGLHDVVKHLFQYIFKCQRFHVGLRRGYFTQVENLSFWWCLQYFCYGFPVFIHEQSREYALFYKKGSCEKVMYIITKS